MQCLAQFFISGIGLSQLQVIADSTAHQGIALWHETETTADSNLTTGRLDKAENQAEQGGLANACLTHDGSLRARLELMCKVRENLPVALGIAERDIVEADSFILARMTRIDTAFIGL